PVESVSWSDAQSFIAELNGKSGQKYRLPTEAEWEYAARSGGKMDKWAGTSSEGRLGDFAWYEANAEDRPHRVGEKKPNVLGIYDLTGNVWEWVQDWYDENYYKAGPKDNPQGPNDGTARILRGGCWLDQAKDTRSSFRFFFNPGKWFKSIGVRLVRTP
ncbi:MAG: formylglycine-generating enzyme family protein, partial [Syntrophales bacterium]|nr:formylglycine-generating enzyme family protein [Syntrophales bacterium]